MKKSTYAVTLLCTALLTSCFGTTGGMGGGASTSNTPRPAAATNSPSSANANTPSTSANGTSANAQTSSSSNGTSALGNILGGMTQGSSAGSILGSIIGAFGGTTNAKTIIGTWTYKEPSVQFESSNLLAKAGGAVASQTVVNKIAPYYEKIGIKPGVAKLTLDNNNNCQIALSTKTIKGTYVYDNAAGTLTVKGSSGVKLFTAYISVSLNQLALTLDTSNLLSMIQGVGTNSSNSTLSTISSISGQFNGMKTGFLFTK